MSQLDFTTAFRALTGMTKTEEQPFPWQRCLYEEWFAKGKFPNACILPTGLGKTSVIAIWLIALANGRPVPRRLVYVVNRRTVVDQTTDEVEKYREKLEAAGIRGPLALSTLRGQFADNREWSADPSRAAVVCGTVDMIGSRLLFSGYRVGFKAKPLHAGFLGQDVLLVHDEAHLEPAFQELVVNIQREQHERERASGPRWPKLRVMELTATSRGGGTELKLTPQDRDNETVQKRIGAKKTIHFHEVDDGKLPDAIATLAQGEHTKDCAVLVFVRRVDDVDKVVKQLPKHTFEQLTGTLRGKERDELVKTPIFQRFLPESNRDKNVTPASGTVYLVCTSAGEVGVNISADHLVCDLSTFDSMAQRFGRVNRFGKRDDTRIDVVHPKTFDDANEMDGRRQRTLQLLRRANGNGSPAALGELHRKAVEEGSAPGPMSADRTKALREYILATYAPPPTILPVSDILFDAWALTSIRGRLPGRPPVEPYLHGISNEIPETHVAWRKEVGLITGELRDKYDPAGLLEDYPLKPHELLRDSSARVHDRLKRLKAAADTPSWLVTEDGEVEPTTLGAVVAEGKEAIYYKTVLLPPSAGGLDRGFLRSESTAADDVADDWRDEQGRRRRVRVRQSDPELGEKAVDMRLIRTIVLKSAEADDEDAEGEKWLWYERIDEGDGDESKASKASVTWKDHTDDVVREMKKILAGLPLPEDLKRTLILAAEWHDLGKMRIVWQRSIGNPNPGNWLGKSGSQMKPIELTTYRHEFGSLLDIEKNYAHPLSELTPEMQDVVLHLIATHHGLGRPHFPPDNAFDPNWTAADTAKVAAEVPRRFARLQRKYGRWGLAYLESLLRAADWAASANPTFKVPE